MGLAGGLNLYGFAGGDPVNHNDPFGLCPPKDDNTADCEAGSSGWYANRIATGQGSKFWNTVGGVLASCGESDRCLGIAVLGMGAGGGGAGLSTEEVGGRPSPGDVADAVSESGATVKPHGTKTGEGTLIKWPDGSVTDIRVENHPLPGSNGQPVPHANVEIWDSNGKLIENKHIFPPGGGGP